MQRGAWREAGGSRRRRSDPGGCIHDLQGCGAPVIAYGVGGALETIVDGKTGLFIQSQTTESLIDAMKRADAIDWDAEPGGPDYY